MNVETKLCLMLALMLAFPSDCSAQTESRRETVPVPTVGVYHLLIRPERFDSQHVGLSGFLMDAGEYGTALFASDRSAEMFDIGAMVRVVAPNDRVREDLDRCLGQYVILGGVFHPSEAHLEYMVSDWSYVEVEGVSGAFNMENGDLVETLCWLGLDASE